MSHNSSSKVVVVAAVALTIVICGTSVFAGPPLLCRRFEIGEAKSLPWGSGAWDNGLSKMGDDDFVAQTLALLSPDANVFVRMETIRRATIHAAEHPSAANKLRGELKDRWVQAEMSKTPDGLVYFDYGYLLASFNQMNIVVDHESRGTSGLKRTRLPEVVEPDAYALVLKALEIDDEKGSIEFALALMTSHPSRPAHHNHIKQALGCVGAGSLLASNLVRHFGDDGQTIDELRKTYWSQGDAERR